MTAPVSPTAAWDEELISIRELWRAVLPHCAAILAVALIYLGAGPGFMSYDSLRALEEARGTVGGGGSYPPFVSYLWRPLDWIHPGPALMFVFQDALFFLSIAHILSRVGCRGIAGACGVLLIAACPPMLGSTCVVWKDIGTMAFYAAAVAALLEASAHQAIRPRKIALSLSALFLFAGTAMRQNAFPAVIPLLLWWSSETCRGLQLASADRFKKIAVTWMGSAFVIAAASFGVNNFRFPTFERLPSAVGLLNLVWQYDLLGASHYSNAMLIPAATYQHHANFTIDDVHEVYDPRNVLRSHDDTCSTTGPKKLLNLGVREGVWPAWKSMLRNHPMAYIKHRLTVASFWVGLNEGPVFFPYHLGIDENKQGVVFTPTPASAKLMGWLQWSFSTPLGRVWIYYTLAAGVLAFAWIKRKRLAAPVLYLAASGIAYWLCSLPFLPATDLRYNCWALATALVSTVVTVHQLRTGQAAVDADSNSQTPIVSANGSIRLAEVKKAAA